MSIALKEIMEFLYSLRWIQIPRVIFIPTFCLGVSVYKYRHQNMHTYIHIHPKTKMTSQSHGFLLPIAENSSSSSFPHPSPFPPSVQSPPSLTLPSSPSLPSPPSLPSLTLQSPHHALLSSSPPSHHPSGFQTLVSLE